MNAGKSIAFLGLGVMGAPIASHLARHGHRITGYNRTLSRAEEWQKSLADEDVTVDLAPTPAQAAQNADILISCVGRDEDLEQIMFGENGALSTLQSGSLVIDHTTVSATMARRLESAVRDAGADAVDAPVSGGQAGAQQGKLAIMCGGEDKAFARAQPIMQTYGARIIHIGNAGAGQTAKMANQICIAGILGGLSEAVRLVQASGLDPQNVFDAISAGAAQSWQMDNRWHTMVKDEFDFGFAIDWMRKDLSYAIGEAHSLGLSTPVAALVDQFYAKVQAQGGARQDTSALIRHLPKGGNASS